MIAAFDATVDVGNVLTSITIAVSAIALLSSRAKDRQTRRRELADRIRAAAARTLAKLERWRELSLWYYRDVQPLFVETGERLAEKFDPPRARDFLIKELERAYLVAGERIRDEGIETAYVELYAYDPNVYEQFHSTLTSLKRLSDGFYVGLLTSAQKDVRAYENRKSDFAPAELGNDLRKTAERHRSRLEHEVDAALDPLKAFLVRLISTEDEVLLGRKGASSRTT